MYNRTNWKDRVVEFPNRYKDQDNTIHTLTGDFGVVTEIGTDVTAGDLNKIEAELEKQALANGIDYDNSVSLLNATEVQSAIDENATAIETTGVYKDDLETSLNGETITTNVFLKRALNLSSYQAFCSNINTTSLDCAFGKNNEDIVSGIGLQLAMYAWFKGTSPVSEPFTTIKNIDRLSDIFTSRAAFVEVIANSFLIALINASPFAANFAYTGAMTTYYSPNAFANGLTGFVFVSGGGNYSVYDGSVGYIGALQIKDTSTNYTTVHKSGNFNSGNSVFLALEGITLDPGYGSTTLQLCKASDDSVVWSTANTNADDYPTTVAKEYAPILSNTDYYLRITNYTGTGSGTGSQVSTKIQKVLGI